eukprot:TRINITY_DN4620_c0_g1_i1.p1 TRINITY_DN4620_c0_g1~~TRINITY_DN4620_c0_g1_i1.p1  ORF type:complete len:509 (-),score=168.92 TRINITY_DN4620_c0_g1_i1:50-1543(-)
MTGTMRKKTTVDFLQEGRPRSPEEWMRKKKKFDGLEGVEAKVKDKKTGETKTVSGKDLWRVHDDLFDLSSFVDRHPGGRMWLEETRGTDVTEVFESHHLDPNVSAILHKFRVDSLSSPLPPRSSPFSFHPDGFFKSFQRRAWDVVSSHRRSSSPSSSRRDLLTSSSPFSIVLLLSLLGVWMVMMGVGAKMGNKWLVLASGAVLALSAVTAHNFFHKKDNMWMYAFDLTLFSSRRWRISHAISHHAFANSALDVEISSFEPLFIVVPCLAHKKNVLHRFLSFFYLPLLVPILVWFEMLPRLAFSISRLGSLSSSDKWAALETLAAFFPCVSLVFLVVVLGGDFSTSLWNWAVMQTACSAFFLLIGLTAAHHHPDIWHEGDFSRLQKLSRSSVDPLSDKDNSNSKETNGGEEWDWGEFQLEAVRDRKEVAGGGVAVLTMFGDHALHHLLPTIDHAFLPHFYSAFFETLSDHNLLYPLSSSSSMALGLLQQIHSDFRPRP